MNDARSESRAAAILARLDRLPGTRHVWVLITLLSLGGMFEFYDLFMTAYVVPGLVKAGLLKDVQVGIFAGPALFVAATFIGPVHRHVRVRLCGRPLWTANDLHLFDAVVLRRDLGDGLPEQRHRSLPLAADRRHRHRGRARHHRHLPLRARAEVAARARLRLQPDGAIRGGAGRRLHRLYAGGHEPSSASTAGAGWCSSARSARFSSGSSGAPCRRARAGSSTMDGSTRPRQ